MDKGKGMRKGEKAQRLNEDGKGRIRERKWGESKEEEEGSGRRQITVGGER